MADNEEKLEISLEVNSKGEVILKNVLRATDDLIHKTDEATTANKRAREEEERGTKQTDEHKRSILDLAKGFLTLSAAVFTANTASSIFNEVLRIAVGGPLKLFKDVTIGAAEGLFDLAKSTIHATEKYEKFRITLEGVLKSQAEVNRVAKLAFEAGSKSPFGIGDIEQATRTFIKSPGLQSQFFGPDVESQLKKLYDTTIKLASTNPEQGIPGAVQAIRLAVQGQFRLLQRTYQISLADLVAASGKSKEDLKRDAGAIVEAIGTVTQRLTSENTLQRLAQTVEQRTSNIKEYFEEIIPRTIGSKGFVNQLQQIFGIVDEQLLEFVRPGASFETKFAQRFSDSFGTIVKSIARVAFSVLGETLDASGSKNPFDALADRLATFAETVAGISEKLAAFFESDAGRSAIKGLANLFFAVGELIFEAVKQISSGILGLLAHFGSDLDELLRHFPGSIGAGAEGRISGRALVAAGRGQSPLHGRLVGYEEFQAALSELQGSEVIGQPSKGGDFLKRVAANNVGTGPLSTPEDFIKRVGIVGTQLGGSVSLSPDEIAGIKSAFSSGTISNEIDKTGKAVDDLRHSFEAFLNTTGNQGVNAIFGGGPSANARNTVAGFGANIRELVTQGDNIREEMEKSVLTPLQLVNKKLNDVEAETSAALARNAAQQKKGLQGLIIDFFGKGFDASAYVSNFATITKAYATATAELTSSDALRKLDTVHIAIKELLSVNPEDASRFERTLGSVGDAFKRIGTLDFGFGPTRGVKPEEIKALVGLGVTLQTFESSRAKKITGLFGGSPETEIQGLKAEQVALAASVSSVERLKDFIGRDTVEGLVFQELLTDALKRQTLELNAQITAKEFALTLANKEKDLQFALGREQDPGRKYDLIKNAIGEVEAAIASLNAELASDKRLDIIFGNTEGGASAVDEGRLNALKAKLKGLFDDLRNNDPLEGFNSQLRGFRHNVSAQSLFDSLPGVNKEALTAQFGDLGLAAAIGFLDKFQLLVGEEGKLRIKTFGELFVEGIVQLAEKVADALQTAVGDTLYDIFTGNFKDIEDVWNKFLQSLLHAFTDFIAQLLIKAAFKEVFGSVLGLASGGVIGGVHTRGFDSGGVAGPGAGGALLALIGEGSRREGIVPLLADDSIPGRFHNGQLEAVLPGNRAIPISLDGYANGGVTSGTVNPVSMPMPQPVTVIIVNQLDSSSVVAEGLPPNAQLVENQVSGSIRNRGRVGKTIARYQR